MKIAVAGTGYVGLSIATLLAQKNHVTAVDVIKEKVDLINNRKSPIQDDYIEKFLTEKNLDLTATLEAEKAYADADFVVIAAPTNYDSKKNFFDTSHVEEVIGLVIKVNPDAVMVIKSTIPVGYTESVRDKFSYRERQADGSMKVVAPKIIFAPEFLREFRHKYPQEHFFLPAAPLLFWLQSGSLPMYAALPLFRRLYRLHRQRCQVRRIRS